ncbi:MAG: hypothetical protein FWG63_11570 [Defluviitaleaceae bacterium]|nr:hypothetical protein [Defluviitaleaceae bacterium]
MVINKMPQKNEMTWYDKIINSDNRNKLEEHITVDGQTLLPLIDSMNCYVEDLVSSPGFVQYNSHTSRQMFKNILAALIKAVIDLKMMTEEYYDKYVEYLDENSGLKTDIDLKPKTLHNMTLDFQKLINSYITQLGNQRI